MPLICGHAVPFDSLGKILSDALSIMMHDGQIELSNTFSLFSGQTVILGGLGQILGLGVYFWAMWTRIRPVGSQLREAQGEKF